MVRLLKDIREAKEEEKMAPIARKGYDETLGRFHPWLVRKGVHLAVHSLAHRRELIASLSGGRDKEEAEDAMAKMIHNGAAAYTAVQDLYASRSLLDLP